MSEVITAKSRVHRTPADGSGFSQLTFSPDYQDGRNKEWADATPTLSLSMRVKDEVADKFMSGEAWTISFTKTEGQELPSVEAATAEAAVEANENDSNDNA